MLRAGAGAGAGANDHHGHSPLEQIHTVLPDRFGMVMDWTPLRADLALQRTTASNRSSLSRRVIIVANHAGPNCDQMVSPGSRCSREREARGRMLTAAGAMLSRHGRSAAR